MKQRKSDILWKVVLEDVFPDLLRFIFPNADAIYDMERKFLFLDKELSELHPQPDEEKDSRFADKLVQVYYRDGREGWILLHIEVQGDTSDREAFAERMYTYFYRIRDRFHKPVSALAIFTGREGKGMPRRYHYECDGTRLLYEYNAISIFDYSDEELNSSKNPFAQVIIAAKMRLLEGKISEEELLRVKLLAARRLLDSGFEKATIRAIFNFLRNYVLFEEPEANQKFDNLIEGNNKNHVMNTDDYIKMIAREETTSAIIEKMLKKPGFTVEEIAELTDVTVGFVNEIKEDMQHREVA